MYTVSNCGDYRNIVEISEKLFGSCVDVLDRNTFSSPGVRYMLKKLPLWRGRAFRWGKRTPQTCYTFPETRQKFWLCPQVMWADGPIGRLEPAETPQSK